MHIHPKKGILMVLLFSVPCISARSAENNKDSVWTINFSYKGDLTTNLNGGNKTGLTYLGLADLSIEFNTQKMGLWKGGTFMIHGENTHGGQPTANYVGDYQGVDNIEAEGNHTFMYELWYKQSFNNLSITAGLQDLNANFANSDVAGLFINSSFGIHSIMATNFASPIYPLTSTGITFCWDIKANWGIKAAYYKGCPIDFESNPHNLKWSWSHDHGELAFGEVDHYWSTNETTLGVSKIGIYYDYQSNESSCSNMSSEFGIYLTGDQQLTGGNSPISLFYQAGTSPNQNNQRYFGAGLTCSGILSKKQKDQIGLAVAHACVQRSVAPNHETTVELTYNSQLADWIYIQPDLQYIFHPAGTGESLPNATFGLIRLGIDF